ncbi:MAG: hypothetical protein U0528_00365 [Anaerolineae bacterium]
MSDGDDLNHHNHIASDAREHHSDSDQGSELPPISSPGFSLDPDLDPRRRTAPIRPVSPEPPTEPVQPLMPSVRSSSTSEPRKPDTGDLMKDPERAEEALIRLREKTAQISMEFSEGKLNRAQFAAMYARFNEIRTIIEQIIANNPNSTAWQNVARPGHTGFLRQHYEAQPLAFSIHLYEPPTQIANTGVRIDLLPIPESITNTVMSALRVFVAKKGIPGPAGKVLEHGKWITIVAGEISATLVLWSLEPAARQVTFIQDLHRDFERANKLTLDRGVYTSEQLVFPHRSLLKQGS